MADPSSSSGSDPLSLSLDLLRRLPPSNISANLDRLVSLCPHLADDLYSSVDQPLRVRVDKSSAGKGREYLACDYNRDGDSWRSPWSNEYDPPLGDGTRPSRELRDLEVQMGGAMDVYRQLYYDTGLSSVYLWDLDDGAFAGVVLFKKSLDPSSSSEATSSPTIGTQGSWDSLHVFEATPDRAGRTASYKLTSTVMLTLAKRNKAPVVETKSEEEGSGARPQTQPQHQHFELAGSLTRQAESDAPLQPPSSSTTSKGSAPSASSYSLSHIANLGRLIEDVESKMRNQIVDVYFGKTRDVLGMLRSKESLEVQRREQQLRDEMRGMWAKRGAGSGGGEVVESR